MADSNLENGNESSSAADEPKISAGASSLKAPKMTTKDTKLPKSMTKVLARPMFKAKSSKLAPKKTNGGTTSKQASALSEKVRKSAPASPPSFTGSMLPRIAATTTASVKAQYPDLNGAGETLCKRKRGEGKTQPAKKKKKKKKGTVSATEEEKLWKPTDPFNIQYPRCAGCQAVFCTCGYRPEYCSCTCWSCGRKAGGKSGGE